MRSQVVLVSLVVLAACNDESLDESQEPITLPPNFVDRAVAAVGAPTGLAFTPDGRLLVTTQPGTVRVIVNGQLRAQPALDLGARLCSNSERGLLGIAVDPQFAQNGHIYLYYTFRKFNSCVSNQVGTSPVNRVSRFTYNVANDTIAASSEVVLVDNILSLNGNHNGGDVHVGADGMLYVAVGDSGCEINGTRCAGGNPNARFRSHLSGKILRVNRSDGTPPSDNPFFNLAGARRCGTPGTPPSYPNNDTLPCREIWSYGLRNPFRFAFQPGTSQFLINDVGQNVWEEIDENVRGANYGWNVREGFCANAQNCTPGGAPPAGLTNPIFAYARGEGCASITGGAFVPAGAWGAAFDGDYLFGDFVCGKIFRLERSGSTVSVSTFASEAGGSSVVAMRFGPGPAAAPALYYTTFAGGGSIRRIEFTGAGANDAPTAVIAATPTSGSVPLTVSFNGSASSDPDPGDSITIYRWSFGDGATQDTTTPTVSHVYRTAGAVTASLRVIDELGAVSAPANIRLVPGGTPPTVTITSPSATATFRVGQVATLTATASDPQDGTLPATALSWQVLKHHAEHTHSFFGPATGNNLSITTDPPEDLLGATNSFLGIRVTATDSSGLSTTVTREFQPAKVNLTFQTVPSGLTLILDNTFSRVAPTTVVSWHDWRLAVRAPDQVVNGVPHVFQSWSDGGARDHSILTPGAPATFTATFVPARFSARVNFQPAASAVPPDHVADSGAVFGSRGNGLSYGWNLATNETRDRDHPSSPDQRFDTLNHMQKASNPNARWEIAVPNGTYRVRVVAGDPGFFDGTFRIAAEATLVVSGTPSSTTPWIDSTTNVTVSDGRLTLSSAAGAVNNKLCFVELTQL
jgi:glucose/arabinose dehydrogenase